MNAPPRVREAFRVAARPGERWSHAELHRRPCGVLLRLGPGAAARAEGEFRRPPGIARSQSALMFELGAARDLARLRRDRSRVAEGRDVLAPVYARFIEGPGFPDLLEARAPLAELGAAPLNDARGFAGAAPAVSGDAADPAPER